MWVHMDNSYCNKVKIISALSRLTVDASLREVKVNAICEEAGISRQTFYRCFEDKYAAAYWFLEEGVWTSIRQIGISVGWETGLRRAFGFISRNREFIKRLYNFNELGCKEESALARDLSEACGRHFEDQYEACTGNTPDQLISFQSRGFALLLVSMINKWVLDGEPELDDMFFESMLTLVPRELYHALDIPDMSLKQELYPFF